MFNISCFRFTLNCFRKSNDSCGVSLQKQFNNGRVSNLVTKILRPNGLWLGRFKTSYKTNVSYKRHFLSYIIQVGECLYILERIDIFPRFVLRNYISSCCEIYSHFFYCNVNLKSSHIKIVEQGSLKHVVYIYGMLRGYINHWSISDLYQESVQRLYVQHVHIQICHFISSCHGMFIGPCLEIKNKAKSKVSEARQFTFN